MIDPISMAVGAALLAAGTVAGRLTRRPKPTGDADPVRPVCGCGHSLAEHDPKTACCHGRVPRNEALMPKWMNCRCRRYVGPVPLEDVWAPPILPATSKGER